MVNGMNISIRAPRALLILACVSAGLLLGPNASGQGPSFNPPFPRIASRPHGAFESGISQSTLEDQAEIVSRFHVAILSGVRTSKWGNGYNLTTLPSYIKSFNPDIKLIKYTNAQQKNTSATSQWILNKMNSEDWWLKDAGGQLVSGYAHSSQRRINPTLRTKADANGLRHPDWFARYWHASPNDQGSWVAPAGESKGYGLKGGAWDGVFADDQYITKGGMGEVTADYDRNGANDDVWDSTVRQWVMDGEKGYRDAWAKLEPDWYFFGNMTHILSPNETVPTSFEGTYDGGLLQDVTNIFETRPDGWSKMMQAYRRGMALARGAKLVVFHSNVGTWKEKYAAQGEAKNYSVYRWNRYGMTACLMDDGYYAMMVEDGPPELDWFDEFDGGNLNKVGYLGYPIDPPQKSPWSQGVYRREFDNGLVLVNPKGNGTKTVDVGSGWKRLSGTQDPAHNNGQPASTITLPEQDGIILIRSGAQQPSRPKPPDLYSVD
jgi:hypothetical protein